MAIAVAAIIGVAAGVVGMVIGVFSLLGAWFAVFLLVVSPVILLFLPRL